MSADGNGAPPRATILKPLGAEGFPSDFTLSVSVDCDGLADYLNFAPLGHRLECDDVTYPVLIVRLLRLFERHGIKATFFCIGRPLLDDPRACDVMREAVAAGHRIGNHTLSHNDMAGLDAESQRNEIIEGHRAVEQALDVSPLGYRGPAYFLSEPVLDTLVALNYRYDSSANPAPLVQSALRTLAALRTFRMKPAPPLQHLFVGDGTGMLCPPAGGHLLEWPIPVAYGLPFYGTFHAITPRRLFYTQLRRLRHRRHLHYELHPIEVIDRAIAADHCWLPTAKTALQRGRDLVAWLDERLGALISGRRATTLEDLSVAHCSVLHRRGSVPSADAARDHPAP